MWVLGASLGAACTSPDVPSATDTSPLPLIGRLQSRDSVTDLTVRSFADGPNAVPTNSYARVVADIAPSVRHDSDSDDDDKGRGADTDFGAKRGY